MTARDRHDGMLLQDEHGQPQPVTPRAVAMMVQAGDRLARVVVLDARYTAAHADALRTSTASSACRATESLAAAVRGPSTRWRR